MVGLASLAVAALSPASALPIITNVVETGGDNEATDTVPAKWTGITFVSGVAGEPLPGRAATDPYTVGVFGNHAPTFVDRNHRYTNGTGLVFPPYLLGAEYIMSGNDNRDNAAYTLDVAVGSGVRVYMLIDNRLSDANGNTPPTFDATHMQWILDEGWEAVSTGVNRTGAVGAPDELGIDEGADGTINQHYSIYSKLFPAGTFRLRQADNAGQNMYGVVVVPAEPPVAPLNLKATSGDGKVSLDWSSAGGATGYVLKRGGASGGPYDLLVTNLTTLYVDTAVVNNQTYYYVVSAFNGLGESPNSNEAIGAPKTAPTGVTATGGSGQVVVNWTAFPGATSYTVSRSDVAGGPYAVVGSGLVDTTFTDTTVNSGRIYYYVVTAQTAEGPSGQSEEASGLTSPGAPSVTASVFAATAFRVSWVSTDPVVTSFSIEESLDGTLFQEIATAAGNVRVHYVGGVFPSETRLYRVRAINASGTSGPSNASSVTSPSGGYNINFANAINGTPPNNPAPTPVGYAQDIGEVYGDRGGGLHFGWNRDVTADSRWRMSAASADLRYDTFNHFQKLTPSAIWEMEIPNGLYSVFIVSGDATAVDSVFQHDIEGIVTPARTPAAGDNWRSFTNNVLVQDGRLTVTTGPLGANNKINFIDVYPITAQPVVIGTQPASQTIEQNRPVTLSVELSAGTSPFTYTWSRDGTVVSAGTVTESTIGTLVLPRPQPGDSGEYTVTISNFAGSVTSAGATLNVTPDVTAPRVLSVGSLDGASLGVRFSEEMGNANGALGDYFTYNIATPADPAGVSPSSVIVRPDNRTVRLNLAAPISGPFWLTIMAEATDLAGNPIVVGSSVTNVVAGFTTGDIGAPGLAGSNFTADNQTIELVGGGADIWTTADQGYFATKSLSGDFDTRVHVADLRGSNAITKAVLVVREDLSPGARSLHVSVNPVPPGRNQLELGGRLTTGGATAAWGGTFVPANIPAVWMRITRVGDLFTGYRSVDGENWIAMGSTTLALPASVAVGLAVTAHDNTQLATGVFTDFSASPLVSLQTPSFDGTSFSASVKTSAGASYRIEYSDNLSAGTWTTLTTIPGDGSVKPFADANPLTTTGIRVYRVVIE
jgi:hypothetical protein